MKVLFVLKEMNETKHFRATNITVNTKNNIAKLNTKDLKLLAFTQYTVTAFPANNKGSNTSNSVKKETYFRTNPQSKVLQLLQWESWEKE